MCFVVVGLTNHKEKRAHMICLTKCNQTTQKASLTKITSCFQLRPTYVNCLSASSCLGH